jgi:hypothetical protein
MLDRPAWAIQGAQLSWVSRMNRLVPLPVLCWPGARLHPLLLPPGQRARPPLPPARTLPRLACRALASSRSTRCARFDRRAGLGLTVRLRAEAQRENRSCSTDPARPAAASRDTDTQQTRRSRQPTRTSSRSMPTSRAWPRDSAAPAQSAAARTAPTAAAATRKTASSAGLRAHRGRAAKPLQRGSEAPTYAERDART